MGEASEPNVVITRSSTIEDALSLAPRLSPEDAREVATVGARTPEAALRECLGSTECYSILSNDVVVGMFGLHHMPEFGPGQACIWLLTSPEVVHIKPELIKGTYEFLEVAHKKYPRLWNVVASFNEGHIKWIKRCGFTFTQTHDYNGTDFLEFERIRHHEAPAPRPSGMG